MHTPLFIFFINFLLLCTLPHPEHSLLCKLLPLPAFQNIFRQSYILLISLTNLRYRIYSIHYIILIVVLQLYYLSVSLYLLNVIFKILCL